jgi:hypothetical protein
VALMYKKNAHATLVQEIFFRWLKQRYLEAICYTFSEHKVAFERLSVYNAIVSFWLNPRFLFK